MMDPTYALILRAFAVFDGFDFDHDDLWWRVDGEYAPATLLVNCNDLFYWGCADSEVLTTDNIGLPARAFPSTLEPKP